MMLALTRQIGPAFVSAREGRWEPGRFLGMELRGKTLGIVGLGPIGTEMARLAAGIGMRLLGWTRRPSPDRARHGLTLVGLDELFATADVVSLHCTRSDQTRGLIDAAALATMKPGSYLINTAGGDMVDEAALLAALESGRLAGAALDVFGTEPLPPDSPLLRAERLVLTPHLAGAADDVVAHHAEMICDDLALLAAGQEPVNCANRAEVLPITPPHDFARMRATSMFVEGDLSRLLLGQIR